MIRKVEATDYPRLMEIWESAVSSTHDFLKEEDFLYYKEQLPVYFQHVTLFGFEQEGILAGFMGIAKENLEMLFIDNNYRGIGIGKKLIERGHEIARNLNYHYSVVLGNQKYYSKFQKYIETVLSFI